MTGIEALQALFENNKVRCANWLDGQYLYFDNGIVKDENGEKYVKGNEIKFYYDRFDDKWEEYVMPKTTKLWIKDGDKDRYKCPNCAAHVKFDYFYDAYTYCPFCANKNIITQ